MDDLRIRILIITLLLIVLYKIFQYTGTRKRRKNTIPHSSSFAMYPIITIAANSILIDENCKLLPHIKESIDEIKATSTIYAIVKVKDLNDYEKKKIQIIDEIKSVIDEENILFCETNIGRSAMSRQLESSLLIEYDVETAVLNSVFSPTALITTIENDTKQIKWKAKDLKTLVADQYQSFEHSKFNQ